MSKRSFTSAAAIPMHFHIPHSHIFHRLAHLPPALKSLSCTISTDPWPFIPLALDIWQFQDNNCHDELLVVVICSISILQEARLSFHSSKPTAYVTDTQRLEFAITRRDETTPLHR